MSITPAGDGNLQIGGFPDGVKLIRLSGKKARRLADLALHRSDLQFALESLDALNIAGVSEHVRESLWRSAIFHFYKCFDAGKSRFSLQPDQVYKDTPREARMNFDHFKLIRDKHFAHDESPYAQAVTGAVLNNGKKSFKIERIIVSNLYAGTLDQNQFSNFRMQVLRAQSWAERAFDELCAILTQELEAVPYDELLVMPPVTATVPTLEELGTTRKR